MTMKFKDSNGQLYEPDDERLVHALNEVADDWLFLSLKIRLKDEYAPHVTEQVKNERLSQSIKDSRKIRNGSSSGNFTIWQRVNAKLTGECVPLFNR